MADRGDVSGGSTSPGGQAASADPRGETARREMQQLIASTLSEIQQEQGRHAERFDGFGENLKTLGEKIDKLVTESALMNATLNRVEPKIGHLDTVYKIGIGVTVGVGLVIGSVGTVLYWTNSARLDRLIKVLDSQAIEKVLKKDGR